MRAAGDNRTEATDRGQNTDQCRTMGITMNTQEKEKFPENTPRKDDMLVGIAQTKDVAENIVLKSDKINPTEKDLTETEMGIQQRGLRALKDGQLLPCLYHP